MSSWRAGAVQSVLSIHKGGSESMRPSRRYSEPEPVALMLIQPLEAVLAELARLLRPGGVLAVLLPSNRPLSPGDVIRYTRLLVALRCRLHYPNDRALRDPRAVFEGAGFVIVGDERRRFACRVRTQEMAALCVTSLYLPDERPERMAPALAVASSWVGKSLGVPLRRIIAQAS